MTTEGQRSFLGYLYVARKKCGKVSAASWDDKGEEKDNAASIAGWVKRGDRVEKVARHEGDPHPEWICESGEPCACRDAEDADK